MLHVIEDFIRHEGLPSDFHDQVRESWGPLKDDLVALHQIRKEPLIVGLCGSQGTGKSTLAKLLTILLNNEGKLRAAHLSLDDVYLPRQARLGLAAQVHPLLATRGVPGTHDVELAIRTIEALAQDHGEPVALPAFDKSTDERIDPSLWVRIPSPVDIILLEGWCVGANAQPAEALRTPVNALEREEDPDGRWRQYANDHLAGPYRQLFELIDHLIYLKAPDFAAVRRWRGRQETKLKAQIGTATGADKKIRIMDEHALDQFVLHFERITRHLFATMPYQADRTYVLDDDQKVIDLAYPPVGLRRSCR